MDGSRARYITDGTRFCGESSRRFLCGLIRSSGGGIGPNYLNSATRGPFDQCRYCLGTKDEMETEEKNSESQIII